MVSVQLVGHLCVDLVPALADAVTTRPGELVEVGPVEARAGGTVANCARTMAALGEEPLLHALVGNDPLGTMCIGLLEAEHPGRVRVETTDRAATSYSLVIAPPGVDRSFWHHTGANDEFRGQVAIEPGGLLHFGYPTLCPAMCEDGAAPLRELFHRAHEAGAATSLDLAYLARNSALQALDWEALLVGVAPLTDLFCPSVDDLRSCLHLEVPDGDAVGDLAAHFVRAGAATVLITAGANGAHLVTGERAALARLADVCGIDLAAWAGRALHVPAAPIPPGGSAGVGTTGAGDTFKAAFLVALTRGASPEECLEFASTVVARHIGGLPLRPSGDEGGAHA
ncbi:carbohydrate kinase family protein [Schaalia sp. 19OD2882]|uniref:carbohydrate kinase family protein n=1 Tax=Schaalia sp. 19OD2882 TaxID=2794089 RepID=UPI001C1EA450|nr:carbohydrate kinase family protein [Schaalia sp. 19OD2882]QWW19656.1 carbohydrate kinase family protein [Schaalia sp. 19OD2882]